MAFGLRRFAMLSYESADMHNGARQFCGLAMASA